jgi:hypothetical protein
MTRSIALGAFAILLVAANTATALPPIPGLLGDALKDNADATKFLAEVGKLRMKCDVCHRPGVDKAKAKDHGLNDFGEAMHKSLDIKAFKDAIKAKDKDAQVKLLKEGVAKASAEKNADGKTFGELIKAGSLPGKNG